VPSAPPSDVVLVESPMVGNFYRASSPDADPFVQEGDRVEVGQTLCILEAMKLFNEFKSDHAGTVRKVLVDDAQPVEFGQPLFELAPL
jgi:acetyl-CoA carboxylase biotin carboxyl carrier protein